MTRPPPPPGAGVDQLIERGLERYGAGDVDGALMAWEQALGLAPEDVRAAAYVDYVRENYEMLQSAPRLPDVDVPFGLGSVAGDDAYEVEVTGAELIAKVERYIESVDEGWFLDDEPGVGGTPLAPAPRHSAPTFAPPVGQVVQAPARTPGGSVVAVSFKPPSDEADLDFGGIMEGLEPPPPARPPPAPPPPEVEVAPEAIELAEPPPLARPSRLQLPLSASSDSFLELEAEAPPEEEGEGITLEMEADEPELDPPPGAAAITAMEDEQTRDFVAGNWPPPPDVDLDFTDQRSAVPTREMAAPRGFVRAKPDGMAPVISAQVVPMVARGPKPLTTPPIAPEAVDDDLATRPGNDAGQGTQDPLDRIGGQLSSDALAEFGGPGTSSGRAGPNDLTRETPPVRVRLPVETTGEHELEPGDDERTTERSASGRMDTASETTMERLPISSVRYSPQPLDDAHEGREPSGAHPPLVIIEDRMLGNAPAASRTGTEEFHGVPAPPAQSRVPTDELNPGTVRLKRPTKTVPPPMSPVTPGGPGHEALAATLEVAVEAAALPDEGRADRTRRRVTDLIERAVAASTAGDHPTAIVALDIALAEDPESAIAQKLLHRHQPAILDCYQRFVGNLGARPALAMPMHELAGQKLDIRAAFLLSRIDGTLTFEEVLDVSGMARPEAFRHLSILLLRGILEVR